MSNPHSEEEKKVRSTAFQSPPTVSVVIDSSSSGISQGPVLVVDDAGGGQSDLFPWRRMKGDSEDKKLGQEFDSPPAHADCGQLAPLITGALPPEDIVVPKKRSGLWWKLISFGVISAVVIGVWGNQIIDNVDRALTRDPYTSLPVAELIKPLRNEKQRIQYLDAAKSIVLGAIIEPAALPSKSNRLVNGYHRTGLTKLEEIGQAGNPLYAFGLVHCTEAEFHAGLDDGKTDEHFEAAIRLAAKSIHPRNMLVAEANRNAAAYYLQCNDLASLARAEKCIKYAIEIDEASGGRATNAILQNRTLLAKVYDLQHSAQANQTWSELVDVSAKLHGEKSLAHARTLLEYANRLVDQGDPTSSIVPANKAADILLETVGNVIVWHNFLPSVTADDGAFRRYLSRVHRINLAAVAPRGTTVASLQNSLRTLDDKFLRWQRKAHGSKMHFDVLVSFADEYNSGGNYAPADSIYKEALLFVQDSVRSGVLSKMRGNAARVLAVNDTSSDRYVLCMAKAARNCMQMNNVHEAAVIAKNCLAKTDPYSSWRPRFDYGFALEQLVYTLGPVAEGARTAELKAVTETLAKQLENRYTRTDILSRRNDASPWKSSTLLRAELAELQGDLPVSEAYYKKSLLNRETATTCGALGAFYMKLGRYDDAATLLAKSERLSTTIQSARAADKNSNASFSAGTTVNLARIKRLIEAVPNQEQLTSFEWYPFVVNEIARAKTSVELGRNLLDIDLRPLITDCLEPGVSKGRVYCVSRARADLRSLPQDKRAIAQRRFKWYQICFPQSAEDQARSVAVRRELLPSAAVSGMASQPLSPAELVPQHILVISEADHCELEKLLGRPVVVSNNAPIDSQTDAGVMKLLRKFKYTKQR